MGKGEATREFIVDEALSQAIKLGLEGLTLGVLADTLGLSKSGLFAHFRSKEALQIAVLEEAIARFARKVLEPAMTEPEGKARLETLFHRYLDWIKGGKETVGCLFMTAAQEFDDRPGAVRDRLVSAQTEWRAMLAHTVSDAVAKKEFRADSDPKQIAFEIVGIALVYQQSAKLLRDHGAGARAKRAFAELLARAARSRRKPS